MRAVLTLLVCGLSLCACTAKAIRSEAVVGPDLEHHGPFDDTQAVRLTGIASHSESDPPPLHISITHGATQDVASLEHVLSDTKSYLAGVTYHRFVPIVSETNSEQEDYWIVGLNLTRTPDRSIYTVLRFPHGLKLAPGLKSDRFEYLSLDCANLDMAHQRLYESESIDKASKVTKVEVQLEAAPPPEAGDCEYNSVKEALSVTPALFKNYDRIKHVPDAPQLLWQPLHVEMN